MVFPLFSQHKSSELCSLSFMPSWLFVWTTTIWFTRDCPWRAFGSLSWYRIQLHSTVNNVGYSTYVTSLLRGLYQYWDSNPVAISSLMGAHALVHAHNTSAHTQKCPDGWAGPPAAAATSFPGLGWTSSNPSLAWDDCCVKTVVICSSPGRELCYHSFAIVRSLHGCFSTCCWYLLSHFNLISFMVANLVLG